MKKTIDLRENEDKALSTIADSRDEEVTIDHEEAWKDD